MNLPAKPNSEQLVRDVARDLMARLEYARPILAEHTVRSGAGKDTVSILDELWASLGNEISERAPWSVPHGERKTERIVELPKPMPTPPEFDTIEELED